MSGKELLFHISDVDDDLIEEADPSMAISKKEPGWQKWVAIAACLCLVVGVLFADTFKNGAVTYAKEMDHAVFFSGIPTDKVQFMTDFSGYSNRTKVRVMLIAYEMEEGYPEIYGQKFDGKTLDELMDEYMVFVQDHEENDEEISERWSDVSTKIATINDEMSAKEVEWIESIGAADIEKLSYNQYLFTIKSGDLEKIEGGNCKYRVIMAPEEYKHTDISLKNLIGEYECMDVVHVPLYSSFYVAADSVYGQKLEIGENSITFGDEFAISEAEYEIDTIADKAECFYGFETVDFMFMDEALIHLFANEHVIINVSGNGDTARIFAGDGYVYLDRGLWGVYKFKAIN